MDGGGRRYCFLSFGGVGAGGRGLSRGCLCSWTSSSFRPATLLITSIERTNRLPLRVVWMRGKAGRSALELVLLITCSPCAGLPVKATSTAEISAAIL